MAVQEGSVADIAGFKIGDVITSYDRKEISRAADLQSAVAATPANVEVNVALIRADASISLHPRF